MERNEQLSLPKQALEGPTGRRRSHRAIRPAPGSLQWLGVGGDAYDADGLEERRGAAGPATEATPKEKEQSRCAASPVTTTAVQQVGLHHDARRRRQCQHRS